MTQSIDEDKDGPMSVHVSAGEWISRLHAPNRNEETEREFYQWLDSSPSHAEAFNRATMIWEALSGSAPALENRAFRQRKRVAFAFAAVLALLAAFPVASVLTTVTYKTNIGEQRNVALEDGSQVALNTNSEVRVRYTSGKRKLELTRGEAIFDVAKNPQRPFTVRADGREILALGTSFVVSESGAALEVTLLEGKVTIAPAPKLLQLTQGEIAQLKPGQQWLSKDNLIINLDTKSLDATTAWRRQELIFDDTPVSDAIAEMNRYTRHPIVIRGALSDEQRISGVFRTTDTPSFVRAITILGIDARQSSAPGR